MPALPLDEAGKYVAGAYVAFLALILIYVAIMAAKLDRMNRELADLAELAESRASDKVAGPVDGPAATVASRPAETGREAEDLRGGVSDG